MRYGDGGGLNQAARARREQVRLRAADLFDQGIAPVEVAKRLEVSENAAYRWRRAWRAGGVEALASQGPPGPDPELSDTQLAKLKARLDLGPAAAGHDQDQRWTLARVAALAGLMFKVRISVGRLGSCLASPLRGPPRGGTASLGRLRRMAGAFRTRADHHACLVAGLSTGLGNSVGQCRGRTRRLSADPGVGWIPGDEDITTLCYATLRRDHPRSTFRRSLLRRVLPPQERHVGTDRLPSAAKEVLSTASVDFWQLCGRHLVGARKDWLEPDRIDTLIADVIAVGAALDASDASPPTKPR